MPSSSTSSTSTSSLSLPEKNSTTTTASPPSFNKGGSDAVPFHTPTSLLNLSTWLSTLQPMLQKYLDEHLDPKIPVIQHLPPSILTTAFQLKKEPRSLDELLHLIHLTLNYSVRTSHPLFLDKLSSGVSMMGIIAELITAMLNANTHVAHVSPLASLMETICLQRIMELIQYPRNESTGLICPGGAMSNLLAMCTARNHLFPSIKEEGMRGLPPLVVFTSQQAHFSIDKAAMVLGIGHSYIMKIQCNSFGQMVPSDLEAKILLVKSKGWIPFFISATSGTTVLGAFDPLRKIAQLAQRYQCWFHVDGSYGGAFLFHSKFHSKYLDGLELSNSFVFNPHKLLGVPLQCSCLLVKLTSFQMCQANQAGETNYLFHGCQDHGEVSILCGRRADSIKLFFCWQAEGELGFHSKLQHVLDLAHELRRYVSQVPGFVLVVPSKTHSPTSLPSHSHSNETPKKKEEKKEDKKNITHESLACIQDEVNEEKVEAEEAEGKGGETTIVCFWYWPSSSFSSSSGSSSSFVPPLQSPPSSSSSSSSSSLDTMDSHPFEWTERNKQRLHSFTIELRNLIVQKGQAMVDYATLPSLPAFFRVPIHSQLTFPYAQRLVNIIQEVGDPLWQSKYQRS